MHNRDNKYYNLAESNKKKYSQLITAIDYTMKGVLQILSLALLGSCINGEIRVSLNSGGSVHWTFKNESSNVRLPATVPGGIYSDLQLAKDLLYDLNDVKYSWVGKENWTYSTTFQLSQDVLDKLAVNLVFHGIDTVGEVYLNEQLIQSVNNMFVRYVIPIKGVAKVGTNTLEVRLKSPITAARELAEANGYELYPNCSLIEEYRECHINFLRKMQASFGWGWAPSVPSVGIWKPVEIEAFDSAIVRNIAATIRKENMTWYVDIECYCEGEHKGYGYVTGMARIPSKLSFSSVKASSTTNMTKVQKDAITSNYTHFIYKTTTELRTDQTEAWWPNGYGQQSLYNLTCGIISQDGESKEESIRSVVIGLRTIELVQEESRDPKDGLSFYFKVNDVPIFAKGANWIPTHVLPELTSDEKTIRNLLQSVKDANMNMLRISGSGIYESDLFYKIADELGILIWQDMMFSTALYPANKEFFESVTLEVTQQVQRLKAHPSVGLWNGNSEIEYILANDFTFGIKNVTQRLQDYNALFVDTIKPVVENLDPSRWYATSSPSNGKKTDDDRRIPENPDNPNNPLYGDIHYLNYEITPWDMSSYPNGNFISEYGFQSMPSILTLSKAFKPGDLRFSSKPSQSRQHLPWVPNGYNIMKRLISMNLPLTLNQESQESYDDFIYYSQIMQAMAVKIETEKYRIQRMSGGVKGTMGALYSQLNDVWQAPTWSSIEYGGRWKMLHYYAAKFFAPLIVVPYLQLDTLRVYAVSDLQEIELVTLIISLYSWDSMTPKHKIFTNDFLLENSTSHMILELPLTSWLYEHQCDINTCFLSLTLEGTQRRRFSVDNFLFLQSFTHVSNLEPAALKASVRTSTKKNEVLIDVSTDRIAPFVWLETEEDGTFSDNGFIQITNTKTITFRNKDEGATIDIDKLRSTLKIRSLFSNSAAKLTSNIIIVSLLLTFFSYVKNLW